MKQLDMISCEAPSQLFEILKKARLQLLFVVFNKCVKYIRKWKHGNCSVGALQTTHKPKRYVDTETVWTISVKKNDG